MTTVLCYRCWPCNIGLLWYLFFVPGTFHVTLRCCGIFCVKALSIWHLVGVIPVFCSRHFPFDMGLLWYLFAFQGISMSHQAGVICLCYRVCPCDIGLLWYLFCIPGALHVTLGCCDISFVFQALSMWHWAGMIPGLCSRHFSYDVGMVWNFLCSRFCLCDIGLLWYLFLCCRRCPCHIGLLQYLLSMTHSLWSWPLGLSPLCVLP